MHASAVVKFLLLLFCLTSAQAAEKTFSVNDAEIIRIGNGYILNAQLSYPLTPRVKQALDNGVPITFYQQFELIEPYPVVGNFFDWSETIWSTEIQFELRYHALTEQYVLRTLDTHSHRTFSSLEAALYSMGEIAGLTLPPKHIDQMESKSLRLRTGINLHALPTPMRPGALISSKWQLDSPWVSAQWQ
jgi:hypothetical protein